MRPGFQDRSTTENTGSTESLFEINLRALRGGMVSPTLILFLLDGLANVIDFGFHFWMGRALIPADFAVLQTLNSVVLVYVTASGVFQPVVGRFVAEARGRAQADSIPAIFRSFVRAAVWLGLAISILVVMLSGFFAQLLNLPIWTIQLSAVLILLSTLRPIAAGLLQGQENFAAFGLTRLALSLGRIVIVFVLLQMGLGLTGAVVALPAGWLVSVLCTFALLPKSLWRKTVPVSGGLLREGWKLSIFALLAYIAYMSLTSIDLVWVNQHLSGNQAGAYASVVLMRRIVALLPGVAVTVMFPRIASTLAQGKPVHHLLLRTAAIILAASGFLTILYFIFADQLITLIFGVAYQEAASLLGPMGIAMIGVSFSSIWLNYYLAEEPGNFVVLLGLAVGLEWSLLNLFSESMLGAVLAFAVTGWALALGGLVLYFFRLRTPRSLAPGGA